MKMEGQDSNLRSATKAVLTETGLPQEIRIISSKQSNFIPNRIKLRKKNTKPKSQQKKGNIKIEMEINEIESKKQPKKTSLTLRAGSLKRQIN